MLTAGAPAALAHPSTVTSAEPNSRTTKSAVTARLVPPVVTRGEPSGLVAQVAPVQSGRATTLQGYDGSAWVRLASATTNAAGQAWFALSTDTYGTQTLRVIAARQGEHRRVTSRRVTLKVYSAASCSPLTATVDPAATVEARCLAARLDRWRAAGLMGVGQMLNVASGDYHPLTLLKPQRVSVVGFDLEELAMTGTYEYPFLDQSVADLLRLAKRGAVLTASWHALNPHTHTPDSVGDRSWHDLGALLDDATPEAQVFWADFDERLNLLRRLQTGDGGLYPPAAVVFRPFHEVNGKWFWWGRPDPTVFRQVWAKMQSRAATADVHNILWAYSFAAWTDSSIGNPATLIPDKVDLGGMDSYDSETGQGQGLDRFDLRGYSGVAPQVSRMAITEAGPAGSATGDWNPKVITAAVRAAGLKPVWAMLWFDDGDGKKQISSLRGGPAWLRSCANGLCYLR